MDSDSVSFGSNPTIPNGKRIKRTTSPTVINELGHYLLQGENVNIRKIDFTLSYMAKHNLFFDFNIISRNYDSEIDANDNKTTIVGAAMRWNIQTRRHDF